MTLNIIMKLLIHKIHMFMIDIWINMVIPEYLEFNYIKLNILGRIAVKSYTTFSMESN